MVREQTAWMTDDPRGPGADRPRRRHDARGDAGHRDDRPARPPRPRDRRGAVGDRRQPRPAGAVRPPPGRGASTASSDAEPSSCSSTPPGPACARCWPPPSVTEARRRVGNRHLERLRAGIPAELPVLYVPELFTRATGRRVVALVAKALADELDVALMAARRRATPVGLDALLASKEMVLVLGSGGVGKTTIAAALGLAAAVEQGGRVLVLTVDPATRLADALGVGALGNVASRGARRRVRGGRRHAARRAVGGDARHQGRVGRADPPPRARRQGPRRGARQPALPEHHQPLRAQPRLPGDGAAARPPRVRASTTSSSSTRRRRATPCRCSTRRRGCASSSAAGCCGGSPCRTARGCSRWRRSPSTRSPIACSAAASCTTSPTSSCCSRRWRRASSPAPSEVEALLGDPRTTFLVVSTLETAPAHEAAFLARELLAARLRPRGDHRQPRAADGADAARRGDGGEAARRRRRPTGRSSPTSPPRSTPRARRRRARRARRARRGRDALPRRRPRRGARGRAAGRAGGARRHGARRAVARLATSTTSPACMTLVDHLRTAEAKLPSLSAPGGAPGGSGRLTARWPPSPPSSATTRRSTATRCRTSTG